jgi:hypothetical protein
MTDISSASFSYILEISCAVVVYLNLSIGLYPVMYEIIEIWDMPSAVVLNYGLCEYFKYLLCPVMLPSSLVCLNISNIACFPGMSEYFKYRLCPVKLPASLVCLNISNIDYVR